MKTHGSCKLEKKNSKEIDPEGGQGTIWNHWRRQGRWNIQM